MKSVSTVLVGGTIGLSALIGTLPRLLAATAWGVTVYGVTRKYMLKRMVINLEAYEGFLTNQLELVEAFLDSKKDHYEETGLWGNERELDRLAEIFTIVENDELVEQIPSWSMLLERKRDIKKQLETLKRKTQTRNDANELASRGMGLAAFLFPITGVASIGYHVWKDYSNRKTVEGVALLNAPKPKKPTPKTKVIEVEEPIAPAEEWACAGV